MRRLHLLFAALLALPLLGSAPQDLRAFPIDVRDFHVLKRDSGPRNYYRVLSQPPDLFIRAVYSPPLETVTLFAQVPDELRSGARLFRFRWRAHVFPRGGNDRKWWRMSRSISSLLDWSRGTKDATSTTRLTSGNCS